MPACEYTPRIRLTRLRQVIPANGSTSIQTTKKTEPFVRREYLHTLHTISPLLQGFSGSSCEYDSSSCGPLRCRHGASCVPGPRCLCLPGYSGRECQTRLDTPCASNPCYNGGTCQTSAEAPFFHCLCPSHFNGLFCHILDYSFNGGRGLDITPPPAESEEAEPRCEVPQCEQRGGDGVCDAACNSHACGWDGGDCSLNFDDPWHECSAALQCWRYFNDGKCDMQCHSAGCLYDGFDCHQLEGQCK